MKKYVAGLGCVYLILGLLSVLMAGATIALAIWLIITVLRALGVAV